MSDEPLDLENLLNSHPQRALHFDFIVTDFEIFREFGAASISEFKERGISNPPSIFLRRINIFGDIYWDYEPLGPIQISMANRLLNFKHQDAQTGSFYGHLREMVWVDEPEHLEIWASTLLNANLKEKTLTLNITCNADSKYWPAAKHWKFSGIRTQLGSSRIANRIISKSEETSDS